MRLTSACRHPKERPTSPTPGPRPGSWSGPIAAGWRSGSRLMLVNRLAGLVLPATSKFLIDDVIGQGRADLLMPLALAAGAATVVDAVTAFSLSQVLGVAAQRAIANMRMSMQRHITRLPTSYFDSTQTGVLISRVMNDADGIRNLVGIGPGTTGGGPGHGRHRARRAVLSELAAHAHQHRRARDLCGGHDRGVQPAASAVPRARKAYRRVLWAVLRSRSAASESSRLISRKSAKIACSRPAS